MGTLSDHEGLASAKGGECDAISWTERERDVGAAGDDCLRMRPRAEGDPELLLGGRRARSLGFGFDDGAGARAGEACGVVEALETRGFFAVRVGVPGVGVRVRGVLVTGGVGNWAWGGLGVLDSFGMLL